MANPRIIEPMKINRIPDGKENLFPSICASGEYFAELKKDGYWYMFENIPLYEEHLLIFQLKHQWF